MPIDKENAPLIKAVITTTYGPVLERTLLGFIMKDLTEIAISMKITTKTTLTLAQRVQLIDQELQSSGVKRCLLVRLNALKHIRYSIAEEVLKQYNLTLPDDEISYYHDVMEELLQGYEAQIEAWITLGHYDFMRLRLSQPPVH